ncbi:MAG: hypothetical protein Tsb0013_20050 [Phycisphaerales bacterium]
MPRDHDTPALRRTAYGLVGRSPVSRPHPVLCTGIAFFGFVFIAFPVGTSIGQGAFALVAVPFALIGLAIMLIGLWLAFGSRRVVVKHGRLKLWYGFGPVGAAIPLPASDLEHIAVKHADAAQSSGAFDKPYDLVAKLSRNGQRGMDTITLAEGDDPSWMAAWAHEIAQAVGVEARIPRAIERASDDEPDGVERPPADAAYPDPPASSPVWCEHRTRHFTLYALPDAQAKRRTGSFIAMGLAFILLTGAVTAGFVYAGAYSHLGQAIGLGSFALLFVCIGIALLAYGVLARRERWIIDVQDGTLLATFVRLGRPRTRAIPAHAVRDVRVEHSGESTGGGSRRRSGSPEASTPIMQLQIRPKTGPWLRLMTGCSDASLAWAREVLAIALCLDGPASDADPGGDA